MVVEAEEKAAPEGPRIVSQSWGISSVGVHHKYKRSWLGSSSCIQFVYPRRTGSRLFPATPAETPKSVTSRHRGAEPSRHSRSNHQLRNIHSSTPQPQLVALTGTALLPIHNHTENVVNLSKLGCDPSSFQSIWTVVPPVHFVFASGVTNCIFAETV